MIAITIYSRPGCHLCDEMKALVSRVAAGHTHPISIEEVDISKHADLEARYGLEIPVLMIDGKKAAKYRTDEQTVRRLLVERSRESSGSGGLVR